MEQKDKRDALMNREILQKIASLEERVKTDPLTGLLSFSRFKEEVEYLMKEGYAKDHLMIYTDFRGFKYFNQKYGYLTGDQLLKAFSKYIIEMMPEGMESCFTRIVSDQFLLLMPCKYGEGETCEIIKRINREFVRRMNLRFPQSNMILRTGV